MCEAHARTSPCIANDGNLLIVRQCSFLRKNQDKAICVSLCVNYIALQFFFFSIPEQEKR